ncbi:hypothetical protein AVEN_138735-1, partial [Araneus ventricosus]
NQSIGQYLSVPKDSFSNPPTSRRLEKVVVVDRPKMMKFKASSLAEGWFADNDKRSCFLSDFTGLRRAILTLGDVFIHDNTRPHNTVVTQQLLEQFKWDVSDHPTYSPDLATSDFHFFPVLKNYLGGPKLPEK